MEAIAVYDHMSPLQKQLMKPFASIVLFTTLFWGFSTVLDNVFPLRVEGNGVVTSVKDGVTVQLRDGRSLKLADLDLLEPGHEYYCKAKDYLEETLLGEKVFFDIDDVHKYDDEGEGDNLACIVYAEFNKTHLLNVNEFLLGSGYANRHDYYNEFCACSWPIYLRRATLLDLTSRYAPVVSLSALISFVFYEAVERVLKI